MVEGGDGGGRRWWREEVVEVKGGGGIPIINKSYNWLIRKIIMLMKKKNRMLDKLMPARVRKSQ